MEEGCNSGRNFYGTHGAGMEWATPEWIWKPLRDAIGGFDLGPASGCEPHNITDEKYTIEDDGLSQPWYGDVWVNPPYGRKHNRKWAEKAYEEAQKERVDTITALIPNSTGSQWYQNNYNDADYETHIKGRVSFIGEKDNNASFYSVIITWGDVSDEYVSQLHDLGAVRKIL